MVCSHIMNEKTMHVFLSLKSLYKREKEKERCMPVSLCKRQTCNDVNGCEREREREHACFISLLTVYSSTEKNMHVSLSLSLNCLYKRERERQHAWFSLSLSTAYIMSEKICMLSSLLIVHIRGRKRERERERERETERERERHACCSLSARYKSEMI